MLGRPVGGGGASAAGDDFFFGAPANIAAILGRPSGLSGGGSDSAESDDTDDRVVGATGIIGAVSVATSGILNSDLNLGAS